MDHETQDLRSLILQLRADVDKKNGSSWKDFLPLASILTAVLLGIGGTVMSSISSRIEGNYTENRNRIETVAREFSEWRQSYLVGFVTEKIVDQHVFEPLSEAHVRHENCEMRLNNLEKNSATVTSLIDARENSKNVDEHLNRRIDQLYALYRDLSQQFYNHSNPSHSVGK